MLMEKFKLNDKVYKYDLSLIKSIEHEQIRQTISIGKELNIAYSYMAIYNVMEICHNMDDKYLRDGFSKICTEYMKHEKYEIFLADLLAFIQSNSIFEKKECFILYCVHHSLVNGEELSPDVLYKVFTYLVICFCFGGGADIFLYMR